MLNSKETISFMSFLFLTSWGKLSFRFALCLTTPKKKKSCQQSRAQLAQGCQLSEQWIPVVSQVSGALEHAHGFARAHGRAGLSKANDSDKALKAPLILNYLAISDENGCGILIFCQWESADIFGSFPPFSMLVSMYLIEGNTSAFQSIPTPLKTPPSVS